jgi:hypothetical protein
VLREGYMCVCIKKLRGLSPRATNFSLSLKLSLDGCGVVICSALSELVKDICA